ncbi:hypothetical protein ACHQM5_023965 [Ranunculus cassubicifolius]
MHKPTENHLAAAKRVLRYIKGSQAHGIWYKKNTEVKMQNSEVKLLGFCDSDWAGSVDDMKSTSGYTFTVGSGVVSWSSKKQETVAQSSAEAEYVSAALATSQAIWLKRILKDLGEKQKKAISILCDNKSAIAISKNPVHHNRTRHIAIKHHYIQDMVEKGKIEVKYISTEDQVSDIFTKALPKDKHHYFKEMMQVTTKN